MKKVRRNNRIKLNAGITVLDIAKKHPESKTCRLIVKYAAQEKRFLAEVLSQ